MKKIVSLLFIIIFMFSCSKNDETEVILNHTEYYELVKMTVSFIGSETTGSEMEWQETYILNTEEHTFTKSRFFNDISIEGTGIYTFITVENKKFLELTFNEESEVISNCNGDLKEALLVLEGGNKLVSTWGACDGPGLEYQKGFSFCGTEL